MSINNPPEYENPLPDEVCNLVKADPTLLERYMEEYRIIIETQMHFNDLIIRFRSFTLTAFTTILAGILAFGKLGDFDSIDFHTILKLSIIPFSLWLSAFIIDRCYYLKLLNGAVVQAKKFDDSKLKEYGFFGMTTAIKKKAKYSSSRVFVCAYYLLPMVGYFVVARLLFM